MTLDQLKTDIRNAYEGHDRERLERALALLDSFAAVPEVLPAKVPSDNPLCKWPFPDNGGQP